MNNSNIDSLLQWVQSLENNSSDFSQFGNKQDFFGSFANFSLTQDATVTTNKKDYSPSETAFISGNNFEPGETIQLQVLHTDNTPNTGEGHIPWFVTDGGEGDLDGVADGNFRTTWYVNPDDSLNSTFELTAIGQTSEQIATYTFTDSDPAVQFFYVPFEEDDFETAFNVLEDNDTVGGGLDSVLSITVSTDNTIVYYDHWEDGYETDLDNPNQSSTEIWGDNDPNNGIAPGFTTDVLNAGDMISLLLIIRSPSLVIPIPYSLMVEIK